MRKDSAIGSGRCFVCGEMWLIARKCTFPQKCPICFDLGAQADHRLRSRASNPPNDSRRMKEHNGQEHEKTDETTMSPRRASAEPATCSRKNITPCCIRERPRDWRRTEQQEGRKPSRSTSITTTNARAIATEYVLLSTAIIRITDGQGKIHESKAHLDQGSQVIIIKWGFTKRPGNGTRRLR